jgi:response regulator RpfG family c-di-GMP phosphodiesterase
MQQKEYRCRKVMVIDDTNIDLIIAKKVITKHAFAEEVINMESAEEALEYLSNVQNKVTGIPQFIFLDINMPEMNGFDFLDAYENLAADVKSNCIIIMLTTSLNPEDKEKANNCPYVHGFINKPLTEERLKNI